MAKFTKGNKGKPKGAVNKTTKSAREAMQMAFDGIGGVPALIAWGTKAENRGTFYGIWSKLIPQDITTNGKDIPPTSVTIVREIFTGHK